MLSYSESDWLAKLGGLEASKRSECSACHLSRVMRSRSLFAYFRKPVLMCFVRRANRSTLKETHVQRSRATSVGLRGARAVIT